MCTKTEVIDADGTVLTPDEILFLRSDSVLSRSGLAEDVRTAYKSALFNSSRPDNVSFSSKSLLSSTTRETVA